MQSDITFQLQETAQVVIPEVCKCITYPSVPKDITEPFEVYISSNSYKNNVNYGIKQNNRITMNTNNNDKLCNKSDTKAKSKFEPRC